MGFFSCCCGGEGTYQFIISVGGCGNDLEDGATVNVSDHQGFSAQCTTCSGSDDGCPGYPSSRCVVKVPGPGTYYFSANGGESGGCSEDGGACTWTDVMPDEHLTAKQTYSQFTGCCYGGDHPAKVCVTPVGCAFLDVLTEDDYPLDVEISGAEGKYCAENLGAYCACIPDWTAGYTVEVTDPEGRFEDYTATSKFTLASSFDCMSPGFPGKIINQYNFIQLEAADGYECLCSGDGVNPEGQVTRIGCNVPAKDQLTVGTTCGTAPPPLIYNNPAVNIPTLNTTGAWSCIDSVPGPNNVEVQRVWLFPAINNFGSDTCQYLYVRWSNLPDFPVFPVTPWNDGAFFGGYGTEPPPPGVIGQQWLKCPPDFFATFQGVCVAEPCPVPGLADCLELDEFGDPLPYILTVSE